MDTSKLEPCVREAVEMAKSEILDMIEEGIIPPDVRAFSDLHSYVDANTLGDMCADDSPIMAGTSEEWHARVNLAQEILDNWLRDGMPGHGRTKHPQLDQRPTCPKCHSYNYHEDATGPDRETGFFCGPRYCHWALQNG